MSGRIELELSQSPPSAQPGGAPVIANLTIRNAGSVVDQFHIRVDGAESDWCSVTPPTVSLFPRDRLDVRLEVRVPGDAAGGVHRLRVVATSADAPDETASVEMVLQVGAVLGLSLDVSPDRQTARKWALYTAILTNSGNVEQTVRLAARDPEERLLFEFGSDIVSIPPGGTSEVTFTARPRHRTLLGSPAETGFSLAAAAAADEAGEPLAERQAALTYVPLFTGWHKLPPRLKRPALIAGPLLVAAILGLWFLGGPGRRGAGPSPPQSSLAAGGGSLSAGAAAAGTPQPDSAGPRIAAFGLSLPAEDPPPHLPLDWDVTGAKTEQLQLQSTLGGPPRPFRIMERADYLLVASDGSRQATRPLTVYVFRPPVITSFKPQQSTVESGGKLQLSWQTDRAERVFLDNRAVASPSGSTEVVADIGHEYVLRAENYVGEATARIRLTNGGPDATATALPSGSASPTPMITPTITPVPDCSTSTPTSTPTPTGTLKPTSTPLPGATATGTPSPPSPPCTPTPTLSPTVTATVTSVPTSTFTPTATATFTATRTSTPTLTPTYTFTPTPCPAFSITSLSASPAYSSGTMTQVTVSWTSSGGCTPYTGTLTAQLSTDSGPYATYSINTTSSSGTVVDKPKSVSCSGSQVDLTYTLNLQDRTGQKSSKSSSLVICSRLA